MYTNLDEALAKRLDLVDRIQSIDLQFSERALSMSEADYEAWRVRALRARHAMVTKLQRTKVWIAQKREEEYKARISTRGNGDGLLADLYSLTRSLVGEGASITSEEQALLDDCGAYLQSGK